MTVRAEITRTGITWRPYVFGGAWQRLTRRSAERKARRLIREHLAEENQERESWAVEVDS